VALPVLRTALFVALLAAMLVAFAWSRTRTISAAYQLGLLQREHARLTAEHDQLLLEVEALKAPVALERFARTRLSMAPPAPGAVVATAPRRTAAVDGAGAPAARPQAATRPGRAAAGARAASANAARDAEVPGVQAVALRGPSRVPPAGD
jgi:cell division protein FtsL